MIELKFRDKDHLEELIEEYKNLCVQNIIYGINENTVIFTERNVDWKNYLEEKISILEAENEILKQELSITQDAVNELIFNSLNM